MWTATQPLRVNHAALEHTRLSRRHRVLHVQQALLIQTPMHRRPVLTVELGNTQRVALRHAPTVQLARLIWTRIRQLLATAAVLDRFRQQVLLCAPTVSLARPTWTVQRQHHVSPVELVRTQSTFRNGLVTTGTTNA